MGKYYIIKYQGPFGFIKPWTAVRDSETFSQQFLTQSIVEGIERKLFPELLGTSGIHKIARHRLSYSQINHQQEVMQTRGWNQSKAPGKQLLFDRPKSIIMRGILLEPVLYLAFRSSEDAERAFAQHICLCRNEDVLLPAKLKEVSEDAFDTDESYAGYELIFEKTKDSFLVGFHRETGEQMYGWLKVIGNPLRTI